MSLPGRIEAALACLIGEPMWAAGRAASILWLQFGPVLPTIDRRGEPRAVGTYALHVDCPWRWVEAWGDVRADDHFTHAELAFLGEAQPKCVAVTADEHGGVVLVFSDGSKLIVEPDAEDEDEYWRLLEPARETRHFVVGGFGIEE